MFVGERRGIKPLGLHRSYVKGAGDHTQCRDPLPRRQLNGTPYIRPKQLANFAEREPFAILNKVDDRPAIARIVDIEVDVMLVTGSRHDQLVAVGVPYDGGGAPAFLNVFRKSRPDAREIAKIYLRLEILNLICSFSKSHLKRLTRIPTEMQTSRSGREA